MSLEPLKPIIAAFGKLRGFLFEFFVEGTGFGIARLFCNGAYVFSLDFFLIEFYSALFAELNVCFTNE